MKLLSCLLYLFIYLRNSEPLRRDLSKQFCMSSGRGISSIMAATGTINSASVNSNMMSVIDDCKGNKYNNMWRKICFDKRKKASYMYMNMYTGQKYIHVS